ncbi:MAG: nicotinate-nucleotide--dimethylbenzimidazole phosphoribosyltransferase [Deltaproteobacteria bacterium]|nr:nicotinate-nucleotide--dimethylbenzimidazole phosphoribosyltransferase [Deltaproteobacteria bacterium]
MDMHLDELVSRIGEVDARVAEAARKEIDGKTKPQGSLGRIEAIAVRLASIYGEVAFDTMPRAVVVLAADHGVARRGVSAYPSAVTAQMVHNFAAGGAAVNVLARQMAARTVIVDMGVAGEHRWPPSVRRCALGAGTEDLAAGPAMSEAQALEAIGTGAAIVAELVRDGCRLMLTGEMGIGNSTAGAALTAAFTGRGAAEVTGRGTGVADAALARKIEVVAHALARHAPSAERPLATLAALGGFEIAGLVGVVLGAAAERIPVVLDGFIAGAAALAAVALAPRARAFLFAGHRSAERGHDAALASLGLEPILDLGLRLGEGSGALLALPVLDAAARILREMASFASAGVSGPSG